MSLLMEETPEERQEQDFDIKQERPTLDILQVVAQACFDTGITTKSVDLRPTRHARLDFVS